ncbi:hypothetical protein GBF38_014754 [Nibea albiflora]|uniref:Uncharacterized protein n=1 Tax=Nibea albiflora TaxID=240163 RepID=A0ACB7EJH1_NIBAL|nr:hypothetical protein GBF38_014754 [Nibea albiflora]
MLPRILRSMLCCLGSPKRIDASRDDGSFGRLDNNDHRSPNCKMKKIEVNGNPHLCLFALNDMEKKLPMTMGKNFWTVMRKTEASKMETVPVVMVCIVCLHYHKPVVKSQSFNSMTILLSK